MSLESVFLQLKQRTNSITFNPLLNSFEQFSLKKIDDEAVNDPFVSTKRKRILELVKDLTIDFNPKLKSAFDEYSEALAYLLLRTKFLNVERILEAATETPDFKIAVESSVHGRNGLQFVYAELKTLSYAFGNLNYKNAMNQGIQSSIEIEKQLRKGNKIAFGESVVQPWYNPNKKYDPFSTKYIIEALNEKIDQNIKEGQYLLGETILLIDLRQMILPNTYLQGGVPFHLSVRGDCVVSGVQWHVAFGKLGHDVFCPIEFEGKENIEGVLERRGLLWTYPFIKAVCFIEQPSSEDKTATVLGLHRSDMVSENVATFLHRFCDFVNTDVNNYGYQLFKNQNK